MNDCKSDTMKKANLFVLFLLAGLSAFAQSNDELYAKACKLKTEYRYKEAFPMFQALCKADSNNVNYVQYASYCYSKYGYYYVVPEA